MDEPLEWNTLDEAAAYLAEATAKEWTPRMVVSACLKHYKIGSHSRPRPSLLKAAPPIDTPISVYQFKVGEGMVKMHAGMPPQLFPLYQAQLGDLLTRGKTLVGLARSPDDDDGRENEYVMADERTCVDLAQVGISRRALESLLEIVRGDAGIAVPAKTTPKSILPAPVTKKRILEAFPPPAGVTNENWEKTLGDPPAWLIDARIDAGGRSRASTWNPAMFALCLASEGKMKIPPLTDIIGRDFPKWLPEWKRHAESLKLTGTDRR